MTVALRPPCLLIANGVKSFICDPLYFFSLEVSARSMRVLGFFVSRCRSLEFFADSAVSVRSIRNVVGSKWIFRSLTRRCDVSFLAECGTVDEIPESASAFLRVRRVPSWAAFFTFLLLHWKG